MPKVRNPRNILVVRADRLGDVVLSTPVLEYLKRSNGELKISVLVNQAVAPILNANPFIEQVLTVNDSSSYYEIYQKIKNLNFDAALVLQDQPKLSWALMVAGIGYRVGPYSKMFSYGYFNRGLKQKRSQARFHEAQYNLALADYFLTSLNLKKNEVTREPCLPRVMFNANQAQVPAKVLGRRRVIIHAGMGGSALNWPRAHYRELVKRLRELSQIELFLTGSNGEAPMVAELQRLAPQAQVWVGRSLNDFCALIASADVMIAPSTGPLHLASALKIKTISFYPPIQVQSARRWGPYAPGHEAEHKIFIPKVVCPQKYKCALSNCEYYDCMQQLEVDEVLATVINF